MPYDVIDSNITLYLAPDVFADGGNAFIPVVHSLGENDTVTVNVSHTVSIILPLQPEWWLQLSHESGSTEEMQEEICKTIVENWNLQNQGTEVGNCNLTVLEQFAIDNDKCKFYGISLLETL